MRIGKVTDSVLKRSVLKIAGNNKDSKTKGAAVTPDCALSVDDKNKTIAGAVSTFTAHADHGGYYAVHSAANNLFVCGADPEMVILNVMLPPEFEESGLKEIMRDCRRAADELQISIRGGHTETTDALTRPMISAVAVGRVRNTGVDNVEAIKKAPVQSMVDKVEPGDAIIMTGWAATAGTSILAAELRQQLSDRFATPLIDEAASFNKYISVKRESEIVIREGAKVVHDISGGGVFAALWELSEMSGLGFDVDLKAIPIRQETIEITNFLGLNPYQMLTGGALLVISSDENKLLDELHAQGVAAEVIGRCSDNNDKIIHNEDETRYLDKPASDEILKIKS